MRVPISGKSLVVGLIGHLALVDSVFGVANVPRDFFDNFIGQSMPRDSFTNIGTALAELVRGVLRDTETSDKTLPAIVARLTTKLKDAADTISELDLTTPEAVERYTLSSPSQAKAAAAALMQYRGFILEIPQAPVLPDFTNQPVPIPKDFWNPQDLAPETYTANNPPHIFHMLEKISLWVVNSGKDLSDYIAVIEWLFAARYNGAQGTVNLNIKFFDEFVEGIRALSSSTHDVLQQYVEMWFRINSKYTLGGGLDEAFYEDQRELQAYLEMRQVELKALMSAFWGASGVLTILNL